MKNSYKLKAAMVMILILTAAGLSACSSGETSETETTTVTVSAAASLTDALQEAADVFHDEHPEIQIDFNFGGSGALQQQISQGAPADMFFSASQSDFDVLVENGQIDTEHSKALLMNELVLVTPQDDQTVDSFENITEADQIAVGTPESVPAGKYAMETFETMGIAETLDPLLVYAEDVCAVLTYAERGEVNAGLVYRTDALTSDAVEVADTVPEDAHSPIVYPVGLINESENAEAAEAFYEFLQTEDALAIFEEYGFTAQ